MERLLLRRRQLSTKLKEIKSASKTDSDKKGKVERGGFLDKKKEQPQEQTKEDSSVGLMAPTADVKDEN